MLNVVQTPERDLEPDVLAILDMIVKWTPANGEAIYGSRPWKIYGEEPTTIQKQEKGSFGEVKDVRPYDSSDIRFTQKGETLYAFCMKSPTADVKIISLGKQSKISDQKVKSVTLLGSKKKLSWKPMRWLLPNRPNCPTGKWQLLRLSSKSS